MQVKPFVQISKVLFTNPVLIWKLTSYLSEMLCWILENLGFWFEVFWNFYEKVLK
jgi:hypothetical protein